MNANPAQLPQPDALDNSADQADFVDLREVVRRIVKGLPQTFGLCFLGAAAATILFLLISPVQPSTTSTRVVFAFDGLEHGEYPDHSKFQPDDLRDPNIVLNALRHLGLSLDGDFQSTIRAALLIEGIVPPNIIKDRDRLRASGVTPPKYIPDEYSVTLTLPRRFPLSSQQREQFVNELVRVYRANFTRTYATLPIAFGSAFDTLKDVDYFEYELVLNQEMDNITAYLTQQQEKSRSFRSQTTNLSFNDLLNQSALFSQIRLDETLGIIHQSGISRDRKTALLKMAYYLQTLVNRENKAQAEDDLIKGLLAQSQQRSRDFVLGIKSQGAQSRADAITLDQGLIDSLIADDSYNMLLRKALDSGMYLKRVQAEKARLMERFKAIQGAPGDVNAAEQAVTAEAVRKSLVSLEAAYRQLISNIQKTESDFIQREQSDAIRSSDEVHTDGQLRPFLKSILVGVFLGLSSGMGLSLLGIYLGGSKKRA